MDDPNPIVDVGCPRNVGGVQSAVRLASALRMPFKLRPLDRETFYHGYGTNCDDARLVFAVWDLPVIDTDGHEAAVPFYVVDGNGPLLLGNNLLHKSTLYGKEGLLVIPPGVLGSKQLRLQTYSSRLPGDPEDTIRTRLFVVPSTTEAITAYFASYRTLLSRRPAEELREQYTDRKVSKRFAHKLHGFTHMPLEDMKEICHRAGVLTPVLQQALQASIDKCTTCKSTGRPLSSKKIAFRRLLVPFNNHVQLDFMFISQMENLPILHMVDLASAFSVTAMLESRELEEAKLAFEQHWVNIHGPPHSVSGDPEFDKGVFKAFLSAHSITFEPRPARRHNKMGVVESKNAIVRLISTRLLLDAEYFAAIRSTRFSFAEILSRATFLSNVMYGGRKLSSFEIARNYTPSIMGLPQCRVTEELLSAYQEQVARRAIQTMRGSRTPHVLPPSYFQKGTPVYYFKRGPKFGAWHVAYVREVQEHTLLLSSNEEHRGPSIRAAYEDIRLVPKSALLIELDQMGFRSPLSHSIIDDEAERENGAPTPSQRHQPLELPTPSTKQSSSSTQRGSIDFVLNDEVALWSRHPNVRSFLAGKKGEVVNLPAVDIGTSHDPSRPEKDIGSTPVLQGDPPYDLQSTEQDILRKAKQTLGSEHVSEFRLQFLPHWVIEKAIEKEKAVYNGCYVEVKRSALPRNANIVSSHHFFHIKDDGEHGALRLKCRLVPHGNRDREKDGIRKDSSSAQFPIIRLVVSVASTLGLRLATLDIKGAYLQGGKLSRDIFMVPPKGWADRGVVWKLLAPTYGLVESGRLWQLTIERWMFENLFETVPGLPQIFVLRGPRRAVKLVLAKVVDDLLIAGLQDHLSWFNKNISSRFTVGKFDTSQDLIYNRLRIHQHEDKSITINMQEYLDSIEILEIPRSRRKQFDSQCTTIERTSFLALTGTLNFLGHGVLPQASFAASYLQQRTSNLLVGDLILANHILKEIRALRPQIHYKRPILLDINPRYLAFSDASQGKGSYGQTGYVSGLFMPAGGGDHRAIFHVIDWTSSKQARVCFSSIGAEILAAALSADRASLFSAGVQLVHGSKNALPLVLTVDSDGLYSTITTLHEGRDYRLRPTVARLRDSFEAGEISVLQWVPGAQNLADALTKRNVVMFRKLNDVMNSGLLGLEILNSSKRVANGK